MRTLSLLALSTSAALAACHTSSGNTTDGPVLSYNCAADDRAQTYVAGLEVMGTSGKMTFKLMDASPAPPARGNNTWSVQVNAAGSAGAPVTDLGTSGQMVPMATFSATPYMPDHGHGTPIEVQITNQGSGMYQLTPVNLWMPGYWVTTLVVDSPSVGSDTAVYKFCLPD